MAAALVVSWTLAGAALAREPGGYDAARAAPLKGVPVQLVFVGDHLHEQIPYRLGWSEEVTVGPTTKAPGESVKQMPIALTSLVASGLVYVLAKKFTRPAATILRQAQCELPANDALAAAIERAVHASPWGSDSKVERNDVSSADAAGSPGDLDAKPVVGVATDRPRYVIRLGYSISADFSYVIVSGDAMAYAPDLPGARSDWQTHPAWVDHFVVVSDAVPIPEKSAWMDQAMAEENARFAATDYVKLRDAADNKGDYDAQWKAIELHKKHLEQLEMIRSPQWYAGQVAEVRSRQWSENGCARVKDALHADAEDLTVLLTKLFAGQIVKAGPGPGDAIDFMHLPETPGDREVMTSPGNFYLLRRPGDRVTLMYLASWLPDGAAGKDEKKGR